MSAPELRAARYVRVSRSDQRPALQSDETAELITRRGWTIADTFLDEGMSGSSSRRPGLDRMMASARRREFDILVVWRSDRLFRSLHHMVNALAELSALGVEFVSVTEPFDTTTPQGRLLIHMVAAFAEFERGVLIERTRAGLAAARRRGARIGRPPVEIDAERVARLRNEGASIRAIARELNVGASTVHRVLAYSARISRP
jgi:DNA invertase Pin-like site-specific DNA recombinase